MTSLRNLMNKTRKMMRRFFGVASKPVTATKIVIKDATSTTKKVMKGAIKMAKKPIRAVMSPMKTTTGLAKATKKSVRATTRRIGRLVRF